MDLSKVLLVIKDASGAKRSINLWDAIEQRILYVRVNSMDKYIVCDVAGEDAEYLKQFPPVSGFAHIRGDVTVSNRAKTRLMAENGLTEDDFYTD